MKPIIEVNKVSFGYREHEMILHEIDLKIHPGQIISLLGPNGVGKSTLLNCICGLLSPNSGTVQLYDQDIARVSRKKIAQLVAYVPQKTSVSFDYTVLEFVVMGRTAHMPILATPSKKDYGKAEEALKELSIQNLAGRPISELSGGEQQKACIARALVQEPKLIILDEPTSALDMGNQLKVLKLVRQLSENGYSVLLTTHNPDHCMMLGGDVAIIDKRGRLEYGRCTDVLTEKRLSEVYNADLKLVYMKEIDRIICAPTGI